MYKLINLRECAKTTVGARGRNGAFTPRHIEVATYDSWAGEGEEGNVVINVTSQHLGHECPIWLKIPPDKAIELSGAIREMAEACIEINQR